MRVLVTGGVGFIGSHVCEALLAQGDEVYCLDNFNDYYVAATGDERFSQRKNRTLETLLPRKGFHLVLDELRLTDKIDVRDRAQLFSVFPKHIDAVIHLAALAGVRYSRGREKDYFETNVEGTKNVIEAARENGVSRFAIASSSSVYAGNTKIPFAETDELAPAPNVYAQSKQAMEQMCRELVQSYERVSLLRFFSVYGPRGRPDMAPHLLADSIYCEKPFVKKGDGSDARDWTYVKDIARGVISAAFTAQEKPCEAYNLGNSTPVTLNDLIRQSELSGRGPCTIVSGEQDATEMRITCANIEKAHKQLNWKPSTSLEQGLDEFYRWYLPYELSSKG